MNRRSFMHRAGLIGGAVWLGGVRRRPGMAEDVPPPPIEGKDKRLVVLKQFPTVLQTPADLLGQYRTTPAEILFVRNNSELPGTRHLRPTPLKGWAIDFTGRVLYPKAIDASTLASMPQVEHEMVMQCSGNRRAYFSRSAPTSGTQWGNGALANVRFGGVPLRTVIQNLGLDVAADAKYLNAQGKDSPPAPDVADFEHSIPLAGALEHSILATTLNGKPLPAAHGGPVRLVTPGYYATVHVKWLHRLSFETHESANHNHSVRYRTPYSPIKPGADYDFRVDNSAPTWRMNTNNMVFAPLDGARVSAGRVEVTGVAWNDGSAAVDSVEVSTDRGQTWRKAELESSKSPYAWHWWKTMVTLARGEQEVWARTVDALGRSQPLDGSIHWNPRGYEWNGVERNKVTAG